MTVDDKIRNQTLQYNQQKILALLISKIDKYENVSGEEILPTDHSRMIEQPNFIYSSLGEALEKQTEVIDDQGKKQVEALKVLKPEDHPQKPKSIKWICSKDLENNEIKNESNKVKKSEENIHRNDLIYETNKYVYNFQQFKTIRFFDESIHIGKITISKTDEQ